MPVVPWAEDQTGAGCLMWAHLPVGRLMDMQRKAAWEKMGQDARTLLLEGYAYEADRILDEMIQRRTAWEAERAS